MLKLAMPFYEVKYHEADEWKEISELNLMDTLYKTYKKVTPVIKQMMISKEVETPYGIFRLTLKDCQLGGEQSELFAA
jgi:hypothetical protein